VNDPCWEKTAKIERICDGKSSKKPHISKIDVLSGSFVHYDQSKCGEWLKGRAEIFPCCTLIG